MPTLRVVLDQLLSPVPGGIGRYSEELTRALIATAPTGWTVGGIVARHPPDELALLRDQLPGLHSLQRSLLDRRALAFAWQHGVAMPAGEVLHAPSLLAPLVRHAPPRQLVATIHDTVPWTHPETLTPRGVSWHRAMAARAQRFADAVVVPTLAVAEELGDILDLGDRIHVVGSAVSTSLTPPDDADADARRLGLPPRFILAVGTLEPRKGLEPLVAALADPALGDLPLLVVGPVGWGGVDLAAVAERAGVAAHRVRALGRLRDEELALVYERATVFVLPSLAEGFGIPLLEAMHFGVPIVHSDAPALVEVAGGAGVIVARENANGYSARLAAAIASVTTDTTIASSMSRKSRRRSAKYNWLDSARAVWQLHAGN